MSVADSVVSDFVATEKGVSRSVGLLPIAGDPESASALRSVAKAMQGRWAETTPLLLVDDGSGPLRVIFACSEDIDPVVTLRLHLLWRWHGVRVFALNNNASYNRVAWSLYLGEPWGEIDPALASWLQSEMDYLVGAPGDRTDEDQWKTPIPFGDTTRLFTGDAANPKLD